MDQPVNEKAIKFRLLAEKRVTTVLRTAQQIGKLSRRASYDYSPEQIEAMFKAMRDELDAAQAKFEPTSDKHQSTLFRFT